jgi:hypothetical protein
MIYPDDLCKLLLSGEIKCNQDSLIIFAELFSSTQNQTLPQLRNMKV